MALRGLQNGLGEAGGNAGVHGHGGDCAHPLAPPCPELPPRMAPIDEVRLAFNPQTLSVLNAVLGLVMFGVALIAGGITALVLARHLRHGPVILGGVVAGALVFASLSHMTAAAFSAAALAVVGLAGGMVISLVVAGIQARARSPARAGNGRGAVGGAGGQSDGSTAPVMKTAGGPVNG